MSALDLTGKDFLMELLKCPICLEMFSDPRMLPCQHSFCRCCLERLAENDGRWGRCPQCRQLFRIPFNGIGSFDVNRTIAQLLDTFPKQITEKPALKAKCASCRKEEIITTCEHCKEALCKPCRTNHFNEVRTELNKQLIKIESDSDKFLIKEAESVSKHELNILKCKELRQTIQKKVSDIIQKLKDEETRLLDDVEDFERAESTMLADKTARLKDLETIKEETDQEVMDMTHSCEKYINQLKEYSSDSQSRYITRRISFYNRDLGDNLYSLGYVETTSHQESGSLFSDEDINSENRFETLEMQLKRTPRRNLSLIRKTRYNPTSFTIKSAKGRYRSILEPRKLFQPHKIIGTEGEDNSEFKHPLGVSISPINGFIYVADSWNNRIQIFDENGVFIKSIDKVGQIEFHYPYSVHVDKKGRIYITDQSMVRIKVFDSQFNLIRVIGQYGRDEGCYTGLCDVSTDKDNNIYVCDSGNHRILKFSESGDFLSQWGQNGSAEGFFSIIKLKNKAFESLYYLNQTKGSFKCPACVTVHEDKVIVSDWGNHRVQVFNLDGKFLTQIGKQGTGPGEFKRPLGVAIDEKGNIVIVDEGNNRLQLFRSDFSFHSKINGAKFEFHRPWDVAINKNGNMIVSEYYGHRLQIL